MPDSHLEASEAATNDPITIHNIRGPRDRIVHFKIEPNINLRTSTFLFDRLGGTTTPASNNIIDGFKGNGSTTYLFIDTLVRITSATTSYSLDIPVRYMKKQ